MIGKSDRYGEASQVGLDYTQIDDRVVLDRVIGNALKQDDVGVAGCFERPDCFVNLREIGRCTMLNRCVADY